MDNDYASRSSLSNQLSLNLHYRHPHHSSISQRAQSTRSLNSIRPRQTIARRPNLRAGALEYHHHHVALNRETSDGSSADRLTRVTTTTTPTTAAFPPAFSSPTGLPIQADLWPGNHQQLASGSSINSQQHSRSLPKQTLLRHQQLHEQQQLPVPNASINVSSSNISSVPSFINNTSVTRHNDIPTHHQRQGGNPAHGQHRQSHKERSFSGADRSALSLSHSTLLSRPQTAFTGQAIEMAENNFGAIATTQPASPDLPSPVPTLSSSPGESAATSQAPSDQNSGGLSGVAEKGRRESSKSPASARSQGTSADGNSGRGIGSENVVKSDFPEPASGTTQNTFQNVAASFHFPMSRRSSTASSLVNNSSPPQQSQVPQATQTARPTQSSQQAPSALDGGASYGSYFAYCLDRGNGLYTRLVPADLLPPTAGFLALQNDNRGMIVLPDPSTQSASSIVTAAQTSNASGYATRPSQQNFAQFGQMQGQPPSTAVPLAQRPGLFGSNPKKHKVYCDKWVHEGICAFTQQGCKFKHEMPHDRATQRTLGLFQGYPNWYKKLQAQEQQHNHQHQQYPQPIEAQALAPALAPLALPAPDSSSAQLQTLPTGLPYPILSSSCVPAPPPPPPTPASHFTTTAAHQQPFLSPFSSPTSNRQRTRTGVMAANTNTTADGHWRASVLNAASWRAAPTSTTGDISGTTPSADHLVDNFSRSVTLDGVTSAYQTQQLPQQALALTSTASHPMSGLTGTTAFGSFGYGLGVSGGGFGLSRQFNSLDESNTSSSFGPIGPPAATANFVPSEATSPTTAGFQYRATQEPSQVSHHVAGNHNWQEDAGGHLATTRW